MIRQSSAAMQQAGSFHAANVAGMGGHGTLILDSLGRILSCGAPAEKMFGASQVRLMGRRISEFIAGLSLGGSSPSYNARYLVYLCSEGEWRKFSAKDVDGLGFPVELNLSRMVTEGQEMFLLNVRRAEEAAAE